MIKIYEVMLDLFVKTELCCHFKCVVQWNWNWRKIKYLLSYGFTVNIKTVGV